MSQTSPVTARDELIKRLVGRADAHDKMCFGSPMGLGYFSGNDARLLRDAADLLRGVAQRQQQLQEAVAAAHAAFEAIPIGYPLQQNGRTIDHSLLNEAKRLCEAAVSDTSTDRQ